MLYLLWNKHDLFESSKVTEQPLKANNGSYWAKITNVQKRFIKRLPDKSAYCTLKLLQNNKLQSDWCIYANYRSQAVYVFNWFSKKVKTSKVARWQWGLLRRNWSMNMIKVTKTWHKIFQKYSRLSVISSKQDFL